MAQRDPLRVELGRPPPGLPGVARGFAHPAESFDHPGSHRSRGPASDVNAGNVLRRADAQGKTAEKRTREDFSNRVRENFPNQEEIDPEAITRVVFKQLALRISRGEMKDIQEVLPKKLQELWSTHYLAS